MTTTDLHAPCRPPATRTLRPGPRTGLALALVISAILGVAVARNDRIQSFRIVESSMIPTLRDGDRVLVDSRAYRMRRPARGDVVVFRVPGAPERYFVKRIVGVPGDSLERSADSVSIAGRHFAVHEPAAPRHGSSREDVTATTPRPFANARTSPIGATGLRGELPSAAERILPDQYFVVGDNVEQSFDSRHFGCVSIHDFIGPVTRRSEFWSYWLDF